MTQSINSFCQVPTSPGHGVVPPVDLKMLAKAMVVPGQDHAPMTPVMAGRRSVLDNMRYGSGNRAYWVMKQRRVQSWYPDLIWALSTEQDSRWRRLLIESHRLKIRVR